MDVSLFNFIVIIQVASKCAKNHFSATIHNDEIKSLLHFLNMLIKTEGLLLSE
jgi:hypothetical protein